MADKLIQRRDGNQFHNYLRGGTKKPGRRAAPADDILNLWALGVRAGEIRRTVTRPSGQMFSIKLIEVTVQRARQAGDTRAIYHNAAKPA